MIRRGRHEYHHPHVASFIAAASLVLGVGLGTAAYAITDPVAAPVPSVPVRTDDLHRPGGIGPIRAEARLLAALRAAEDPASIVSARRQEIAFEEDRRATQADRSPHFVATIRSDLPAPPDDSGVGRRVVYSNSQQRVWMIDGEGSVVDSYLVSGRRGVPRPGTYQVFSKSEVAWADHDGITMRYMVRFARGEELAIGFHSIPVYPGGRPLQTEQDLGNFRSAGCVRQSLFDAYRMWTFAPVGTTVVVTP